MRSLTMLRMMCSVKHLVRKLRTIDSTCKNLLWFNFMVWFIQLLELSVLQDLELMLNYRDVNFLSISLDIALSPPQQVVVVACGLTLLHATPLEFCHLLTTMLALCQPYSGENRSLKYVPWACYPVWLRRGLTTQDEGMQLDHAPYHSM